MHTTSWLSPLFFNPRDYYRMEVTAFRVCYRYKLISSTTTENSWNSISPTHHTPRDTNTNHSFKKRKGEELCRQIFPRTTIGKRVEDSSFSKLTITSASNTFKSKVNRSPARPRLGEIGSGGTASRESEGSRPESCRGLSTSYVRSYVRMLCTFEIVARI